VILTKSCIGLRTIRQRAFRHQGLTTLCSIVLKKQLFCAENEEKDCHELLFIADIGKDSDMDRYHRTNDGHDFWDESFFGIVFLFIAGGQWKADRPGLYQEVEDSFCSFASFDGKGLSFGGHTLQKQQHGVLFSLLSFFFRIFYYFSSILCFIGKKQNSNLSSSLPT
jgi:hypothetical protein